MDMVVEVYDLIKLLPTNEKYGLSDQMRRAAVSIPSNIAEGQSRNSSNEFGYFLSIARGSCAELETQLILAQRLKILDIARCDFIISILRKISKMLFFLSKSIKQVAKNQ